MWMGSNPPNSRAFGSHQLAYILVSLEQIITQKDLPGVQQPPSKTLIMPIFAHDFNLYYIRRLLDASWLINGMEFNVATTGSSIKFDLWRQSSAVDEGNEKDYRVTGTYVANSLSQHRDASGLIPPNKGPGESLFLDMPYPDFKKFVLKHIDEACVQEPLLTTVRDLFAQMYAKGQIMSDATQEGVASIQLFSVPGILIMFSLLTVGCLVGRCQGFKSRTHEQSDADDGSDEM